MEQHGLKGPHAVYFTTLYQHPEGVTAVKLAEICSRDKSDVSRAVSQLEQHGLIKCKKSEYKDIEPGDIVSARLSDFGAEVMIRDKSLCHSKYSGLALDNTTLEEIMLYYVNAEKKEWS